MGRCQEVYAAGDISLLESLLGRLVTTGLKEMLQHTVQHQLSEGHGQAEMARTCSPEVALHLIRQAGLPGQAVPREKRRRGRQQRNRRRRRMPSVVGIAFLVVGVVLIIFGMNASASLGSRLSELFTGAPSDRTIWLLVAGVVAAMLGLGMLLVGRRRTL
jgi:hypothetical protein